MCSVIATASSRPFAADSMIESPAAEAGTKITEAVASCSLSAARMLS